MIFNSRTLIPSAVYGIAWCLAASGHLWYTMFWMLIAGFLVGVILGFEGWLQNTLIAASVTLLMAFVALIPGFGELADFVVVLVVFLLKLKVIRRNFPLILTGIGLYIILFYWPPELHHSIAGDSDSNIYNWIDFFCGTALMALLSYFFEKSGYSKQRIFTFTIGLPGFLFLFNSGGDADGGY